MISALPREPDLNAFSDFSIFLVQPYPAAGIVAFIRHPFVLLYRHRNALRSHPSILARLPLNQQAKTWWFSGSSAKKHYAACCFPHRYSKHEGGLWESVGGRGGPRYLLTLAWLEDKKTCYFSDAYGAPLLTFVQSLKNNEFGKFRAVICIHFRPPHFSSCQHFSRGIRQTKSSSMFMISGAAWVGSPRCKHNHPLTKRRE